MRIEFQITELVPTQHLVDACKSIYELAATKIDFDLNLIDRIIVATPDAFGSAVRSISLNEIHTDTGEFVAAGKTISKIENGVVVSDIVLQACLIGALGQVLENPFDSAAWGFDQQQSLYIICHEFGHATDNSVRRVKAFPPDPRIGPFSIKATLSYYGEIVIAEFAACMNSAKAMTDEVFASEVEQAYQRITTNTQTALAHTNDPESLSKRALSHTVCQAAWSVMVELAKAYGSTDSDSWADVENFESDLVEGTPLGNCLRQHIATYPSWRTDQMLEQLVIVWDKYCASMGVKFDFENDGQDGFENLEDARG